MSDAKISHLAVWKDIYAHRIALGFEITPAAKDEGSVGFHVYHIPSGRSFSVFVVEEEGKDAEREAWNFCVGWIKKQKLYHYGLYEKA